jgi:hypothetical protein
MREMGKRVIERFQQPSRPQSITCGSAAIPVHAGITTSYYSESGRVMDLIDT